MLDLPATPALVGNGRNRTSCPKGTAFTAQRRDQPVLIGIPRYWLQRIESNDLPRGYEPRELPMLHAASKVARLELTRMRRSTSLRSQNWRTAEVLIPNALRHPSRFERARGTRRVDCPLLAEDCELESHTREGASRFPSGAGTPVRLVFHCLADGGRTRSPCRCRHQLFSKQRRRPLRFTIHIGRHDRTRTCIRRLRRAVLLQLSYVTLIVAHGPAVLQAMR